MKRANHAKIKTISSPARKKRILNGTQSIITRYVPRMARVPKVIHRTLLWDNEIPIEDRQLYENFHAQNSDWSVKLWNNAEVELLCKKYKLEEIYNSYHYSIQKADFARYLIVYDQGGCYCDFDVKSDYLLRDITALMLPSQRLTLVTEACSATTLNFDRYSSIDDIDPKILSKEEMQIRIKDSNLSPRAPHRVGNYFLLAKRRAPELKDILQLTISRAYLEVKIPYDILYTTGPDVLSTWYQTLIEQNMTSRVNMLHRKYILHRSTGHWKRTF